LSRPANASIRDATISAAAQMLAHANPRRREDASHVLGRLRSDAAIDRHIALMTWNPAAPAKSDWAVIAQAAESMGLIGDGRGVDQLMTLVKAAPQALPTLQRPQRHDMSRAMASALVAAARLGHEPAMAEAVRILKLDPDDCPSNIRAPAAFAIGVLTEAGKAPPPDVNFFAVYGSPYESHDTKLEAIKALGNMRHAGSADRLKQISEADATPDLRWIAHWSHARSANVKVPYTPPTERRQAPVTISDLPKNQP
jgi:HEAT repeat protein